MLKPLWKESAEKRWKVLQVEKYANFVYNLAIPGVFVYLIYYHAECKSHAQTPRIPPLERLIKIPMTSIDIYSMGIQGTLTFRQVPAVYTLQFSTIHTWVTKSRIKINGLHKLFSPSVRFVTLIFKKEISQRS